MRSRPGRWLAVGAGLASLGACGLDLAGRLAPADADAGAAAEAGSDAPGLEDAPTVETPPADARADVVETCSWPSSQRRAPWPMLGGCAGRAGRTVHRGPKRTPLVRWNVRAASLFGHPSIANDGTIYVGANGEGVTAVEPDGSAAQLFPANGNVTNVITLGAGGTLFFGEAQRVAAFRSGRLLWRFSTGGEVDTSIALASDGTVYGATRANDLVALDGADGGEQWRVDLGASIPGSAAVAPDGTLYIAAGSFLFAVSQTGTILWKSPLPSSTDSTPVLGDDGTIYIGTGGGRLLAFDRGGAEKWEANVMSGFQWQQLPAVGASGTIYSAVGGRLRATAPADGGALWERTFPGGRGTSVVIDPDGDLYFGGDDRVFAFDAAGTKLWELALGGGRDPWGLAIGRDRTLYVVTEGDRLFALRE